MKKLFTFFLLLVASIGTMFAEKVKIGDLYYNLDATNQTAEVTSQNSSFPFWSTTITTAIIPASVEYNSVTYSVTSIGDYAFSGCSGLTSIEIPNSVTSIGKYAFSRCTGLTSIIVENGNSLYDSRNNCNAIIETATNTLIVGCKNTTIPNSVTSIGSNAFYGCSGLTSVTIPNSVTSIGSWAFYYCTGLTSLTIGNSVTSIGNSAFYGCSGLTSVTIPNSVTSIGGAAFYGCSGLTSVTIPNSVTSIGCGAFSDCTGLTSPVYNAHVFAYLPTSYSGAYTIPDGIESIACGTFESCSSLTSVTIPNSFTSIGSGAFRNCIGLTSVTIPNSVTSIGDWAFSDCTGLISVTIPNSVTSIGYAAFFGCTGLTSVTIGNSVKSIGDYAFDGCTGLTSVTIPNSVTSIGESAFRGCTGLTSITCEATTPPTLGGGVFSNVDKSIPLYVPAQSVDLYKAADQWKDFTNILPISGTEPETFLISFLNYDGSELQSSEVAYGETPVYTGEAPVKPADAQYSYTFSGWTPEVVAVTSEATYTAVFESEVRKYSITWQDEDGNPIKVDEVAYGETPVFSGAIPAKDATAEYTYEFAGWLPKVKEVTEDAKYTTFFERNKIEPTVYNVHINGENCSLRISNELPAGTKLQVEAVADECFEFQKWSDNNTDNPRTITVTEDSNLTAEFNKVTYTITGENENEGGEVQIIP